MKIMRSKGVGVLIAAVVAAFIAIGAFLFRGGDNRFYNGDVAASDLIGNWIISQESVPSLKLICGFSHLIKRSDHLFVLKKDGSCVVRWVDTYFKSGTYGNNEDEFNRFFWEPGLTVPDKDCSWYVWRPSTKNVIYGPLDNVNKSDLLSGELCKNRWQFWALEDGGASAKWDDDSWFSVKNFRYRIGFSVKSSNRTYCRSIGYSKGKVVIWAPILMRIAEPSMPGDPMIIYEKVTDEELAKIINDENGR